MLTYKNNKPGARGQVRAYYFWTSRWQARQGIFFCIRGFFTGVPKVNSRIFSLLRLACIVRVNIPTGEDEPRIPLGD